jgi:hypothetical protein
LPQDELETFVKIGDEIIQYTVKTATSFTGCTRAEMDSAPEIHNTESSVTSLYRISGNPMDIALKVMLSLGPTYYADDVEIESFNLLPSGDKIDDALIFGQIDIQEIHGVSVGDLVTVTGATNGGNNVVDAVVVEVGQVNDGSYCILSTPLIDENFTAAVVKFKSQFNVLPIGMAMVPKEVDITQHLYIRDTFLSDYPFSEICEEEKNGKDWIEQKIYLPTSCFSIPRKGRSSVAYHIGPIAKEKVITLDATNVVNANQLRVLRSSSQNYVNTVNFSYDYDPVSKEYLTRKQYDLASESDAQLIKQRTGVKTMEIFSKGITTSGDGLNISGKTANRLLKRYARGAEYINGVKLLYGYGFAMEIGDIVAVDYRSLKLSDFKTGTREGEVRLMEVLNRTQFTLRMTDLV